MTVTNPADLGEDFTDKPVDEQAIQQVVSPITGRRTVGSGGADDEHGRIVVVGDETTPVGALPVRPRPTVQAPPATGYRVVERLAELRDDALVRHPSVPEFVRVRVEAFDSAVDEAEKAREAVMSLPVGREAAEREDKERIAAALREGKQPAPPKQQVNWEHEVRVREVRWEQAYQRAVEAKQALAATSMSEIESWLRVRLGDVQAQWRAARNAFPAMAELLESATANAYVISRLASKLDPDRARAAMQSGAADREAPSKLSAALRDLRDLLDRLPATMTGEWAYEVLDHDGAVPDGLRRAWRDGTFADQVELALLEREENFSRSRYTYGLEGDRLVRAYAHLAQRPVPAAWA